MNAVYNQFFSDTTDTTTTNNGATSTGQQQASQGSFPAPNTAIATTTLGQQQVIDQEVFGSLFNLMFGAFKNELTTLVAAAVNQALVENGHAIGENRREPVLSIENGVSNNTYDILKNLYGTAEQRNVIFSNPCKYGTRDFARGDAPKDMSAKQGLLSVMKLYYQLNKIPFVKEGEDELEELERRYEMVFENIKSFVEVQIITNEDDEEQAWGDKKKSIKNAYSLLAEDFIEQSLTAARDGLPLFCTVKHYAVNFFLTAALRNAKRRSSRGAPIKNMLSLGSSSVAGTSTASSSRVTLQVDSDSEVDEVDEVSGFEGGNQKERLSKLLLPVVLVQKTPRTTNVMVKVEKKTNLQKGHVTPVQKSKLRVSFIISLNKYYYKLDVYCILFFLWNHANNE
ncbi:hypothetical protein ABG067_007763, partial [Albugo candida]